MRKTFFRTLLTCSALASLWTTSAAAETTGKPKGFFVSIDGLNPAVARPLVASGRLQARNGLGWLYRNGVLVEKAWPGEITLTAPSHVSTITCSPPSRHGITANSMVTGGRKVSGFSHTFKSEPLWIAAKRQGKKVVSLGYVGTDGTSPERIADFSISYPDDDFLAPGQTLDWDPAQLPAADGWNLTTDLRQTANLRESAFTIVLNPKTSESRTINVLITGADTAHPVVILDEDTDLTNGVLARLSRATGGNPQGELFFSEEHQDSTMRGALRRTSVRMLEMRNGHIIVYVSKASYNDAYPESFRKQLDDMKLVWPDYGVKGETGLDEYLETQAMIDRFLTEVAVKVVPKLNADIVLFYQPLIDSLGHKLQKKLPMPFNPEATDDITKAYVKAFEIVDANMGRLFGTAPARSRVIALMGDHGMDPIEKAVNIAKLLPGDISGKAEVLSSGSLTMLYPPLPENGEEPTADQIAYVRQVGAELKTKLAATTFEGRPVLEMALEKPSDNTLPPGSTYKDEWQYGDALWAFSTHSGFWLQYRPLDQNLFMNPSALGMHGNSLNVPTMATNILFSAPGLRSKRLPESSLMDAVPTFAGLLGMSPPKDCVGQALPVRASLTR